MYKKISDFEQNVDAIRTEILWFDTDIENNPDSFFQLENLKKRLAAIEKSTSCFPTDLKKEMLTDLKFFSNALKALIYDIFKQHIDKHIADANIVLMFMIKYPHLFADDTDYEPSTLFQVYTVFWRFLAEMYVSSPTPEVFTTLCKNGSHLSHEETKSLIVLLVNKFMSTIIKDMFDEVSDWDDVIKKDFVQKTRTKYPNASNHINHILLSKNKRNAIKQDFLVATKNAFLLVLDQEFSGLFDGDFHDALSILAISCMPISDEDALHTMFSTYVSLFLDEQFQKSDRKNTYKQEQKTLSTENMLTSVFMTSQKNSPLLKALPAGLHEQILQYIPNEKVNGNREKLIAIIEKVLQKISTKNESVRKQWFLDKIWSYGFGCIGDDFFALLEPYGFSCVDTHKKVEKPSVEEKDISLDVSDVSDNTISLPDSKTTVLASLCVIDAIQRLEWESKKDYLLKKTRWYADAFEQLGYTFLTKEKFIESSAEFCHSNLRLDKDIRRVIYDIVVKNKQEQHRDWRDYYTFDMANGWRILLYKKGVIANVWPHDYYEKYLKNNF